MAGRSDRVGRTQVDPVVAIVSLGGPRRFMLRPIGGGPAQRYLLGSGDLLVMGGACQHAWEHSIPKVASAPPRMSVTLRRRDGSYDPAEDWMRARTQTLRRETDVSAVLVYQKLRSSGTMAKPRFLTVFETNDPRAALKRLSAPYDHEALRPLGIASFGLLPGLPRAAAAEPDGGLMVGLTN